MTKRSAIWLLIGIIALGVAVRSYRLTERSLWFDESFSWRLVQFSWPEVVSRTAADVHPPLYYFVLKIWTDVLGDSALALRSLSLVFAALMIALIYHFTASVASRRAGLLAATFLALSTWQISFAGEARMYTLGGLLALLSTWLLYQATLTSQARWWAGYALAAAAFVYTHNFAILTLLAHALFLGIVTLQRKKLRQSAFISFVAIALLYLPWLPTLLEQGSRVQASYWVPGLTRWSLPDAFYHFLIPTNIPLAHAGPSSLLTLLPMLATAVLFSYVLSLRRLPFEARLLPTLCFAIPIASAVGLSLVSQSIFQERFLVFAHVWLWVALAIVLARLHRWRVLSALVILFLLATMVHYWRELDIPRHGGVRAAVAALTSSREKEEPILVTSSFIFLPVAFYVEEPPGSPQAPKLVSDTGELSHFAGGPVILPEETVAWDEVKKTPSSSIWVVDTTGFGSRESSPPPGWRGMSRHIFSEVFPYQGEIIVSRWARSP